MCKVSVEASSKKVVYLKINKNHFKRHFAGKPFANLNSQIILKKNFIIEKLRLLSCMTTLELKDCLVSTNTKVTPKAKVVYEIPYNSVVPQSQGLGQKGREVTGASDLGRIEKQKQIEELK